MKNESHLNWKTAAIVGAIAVTTSVGVYYYLNMRRQSNTMVDEGAAIGSVDAGVTQVEVEAPSDRERAVQIKERGNAYFKAHKFPLAIQCYSEALAACPEEARLDRAIVHQNRAVALENVGRIEEALNDLDASLVLHPRYEKALVRRARILEQLGRYRDALIDITAASIFNTSKIGERMSQMESIVKQIAKEEVEKEMKCAPILQSDFYIKNFFESFPTDPLLKPEDDFLEQAGDNNQASYLQCFELLKSGEYQESFQVVENALLSKPDVSEEVLSRLYLLRGTFYFLSCREDLALADFDLVIKNTYAKPSVTVNALIKRAMVMIVNEKPEEVEKAFTEALQIDPECPDIYYQRGSFFESIENVQEAIYNYKRAVELNPKFSFAAVHKVFNESRANVTSPTSYDEFKNLIKRFPKCIECNIIYAQVLMSEGRNSDAEKVCQDLMLSQPKSGTIVTILAMIKLSEGRVADARKLLIDSIKDDPKCSYSYNTLSSIYIKDGDLQKALELLNLAVKYARNRQEMQNFIATREGVHAQLIVSVNYNIPAKDIFAAILRGLDMPAAYAM